MAFALNLDEYSLLKKVRKVGMHYVRLRVCNACWWDVPWDEDRCIKCGSYAIVDEVTLRKGKVA